MKTGVALLLVVTLVFSYLVSLRKKPAPREFKSTDEFIQWLSSEAIKDAEQNNVKLDYSPESVRDVEKILGKLHQQYVQSPSSVAVMGISAAYGAYIGEVIRKTEEGVRWERDDQMGEKIYPLIWGTGHSYPMGWCQRRITDGEEDNVWVKFSILKERRGILSFKHKKS
jgi:hypothetical protein